MWENAGKGKLDARKEGTGLRLKRIGSQVPLRIEKWSGTPVPKHAGKKRNYYRILIDYIKPVSPLSRTQRASHVQREPFQQSLIMMRGCLTMESRDRGSLTWKGGSDSRVGCWSVAESPRGNGWRGGATRKHHPSWVIFIQ